MLEDLIKYCNNHEKVYCYGAGLYGRHTAMFLINNDIKVDGFIVSENAENKTVLGIDVLSIKNSGESLSGQGIIICVGKNSYDDVISLLNECGLADYFRITPEMLRELTSQNKGERIRRFIPDNPMNPIICLYYHRVAELDSDPWNMAVTPKEFERHLDYLKSNYNIIRFDDDWSDVRGKSVVLTFDDGYFDFYLNAYPLLKKYEVPATIFVSTVNIGTDREFWWDRLERILWHSVRIPESIIMGDTFVPCGTKEEIKKSLSEIRMRLKEEYTHEERQFFLDDLERKCTGTRKMRFEDRTMTEMELREISRSEYVTVGAHTVTHPALALQKPEICCQEIVDSRIELERVLGKTVDTFSYPFGNYDEKTAETVRKDGFFRSRTIVPGIMTVNTDPMAIPAENAGAMNCEELADYLSLTWIFKGDAKN